MAGPFDRDAIVTGIYGGIKSDIEFNLENKRWVAALTLTLAGLDAMAYLAMPKGQYDVDRDDFIAWAERYLSIVDGRALTGLDLYGARCAVLHRYGAESKLSRDGRCRTVLWADKMDPPVKAGPDPKMVLVSITALVRSFFDALDRFLPDMFASEPKKILMEERLKGLLQRFPYPKSDRPGGTP